MRTKIALRNLYISQTIIIAFLIFAYLVWFPYSFSKLGGFNKTALMLIFVDLVLGPLLVFIIYQENKKYLTFDINVLLSIQLLAFLFGAYSLYLKHPSYVVFNGDRFTLTNVSHLYPQPPLLEQLKTSFFSSPKFVIAKVPDNAKDHNALLFNALLSGEPDIDERPEYYEPFEQHIKAIFAKSIPLNQLFQSENNKGKLARFYQQYGGKPEDYAYFPLTGNNKKDMIWVFDRKSITPVGIIDSDPWKLSVGVGSASL